MRHSGGGSARALRRAISLLRAIGDYPDGLRAGELRRLIQIPRASLYRILDTLLEEELLVQEPSTGRYKLGPSSLSLGQRAKEASQLAEVAQPVLRDVARATEQLCELLAPLPSWRMLVLDVWHGKETPLVVRVRPGVVNQLYHGYVPAQVFLAFDPPRRLREYLRLAASAEGRRTLGIPGPPEPSFVDDIARWQKLGYVWNRQSGRQGVGRVAVPVFNERAQPQSVLAALGIACASRSLTPIRAAQWGPILRRSAERLQSMLK